MHISNREKKIIETMLINPHSFLTIHAIAQSLGVSSRTIHRELGFVTETLKNFNITLERMPNKGLRMIGEIEAFERLSESLETEKSLDLSEEERKVIIIYSLIKSQDPVKLYTLANETGVSINKLNKELEILNNDLMRYNLSIERKRGEGLMLRGDERYRRQFLADMMLEQLNAASIYSVIEDHFVYQTLNDEKLMDIVDMNQIFNIERLLMDALSELPYVLTEAAYLTLTIHIVLAIERIKHHEHVVIEQDMIDSLIDKEEFKVAETLCNKLEEVYDITIDLEEKIFITMHLRGAKRKADEGHTSPAALNDVERLIQSVESYLNIKFNEKDQLVEGLTLHLVPALNRIAGGLETYNPLTNTIKEDYPEVFNAVKLGLEETFPNLAFPDGEAAFIALHFGGAKRTTLMKHILVICSSGIGTSRILSSKIEQTFPNVKVSDQASVSDLKKLDLSHYDHIVSTVGLDIATPYSLVNPLLPDQDRKLLEQVFDSTTSFVDRPVVATDHTQYDAVIPFAAEGHQLIENIHYLTMEASEDFTQFASLFLSENGYMQDVDAFNEALLYRHHLQGFKITGSDVAIPHLVHDCIDRPVMMLAHHPEGLIVKDMDGTNSETHYFVYMFLPSQTMIRSLLSEMTLMVMQYIDSPELYFNDRSIVTNHMKAALLKLVTMKLK